ncbi:MAG: hypothetical protein ED559_13980 [Phycisphaera sp.]|nr:MAG: hypothetical protein ED559_13980 [Phycisphaera sp.]
MKSVTSGHRLADGLDTKIAEVSTSLQSSVRPIVEDLIGTSHRPVTLARRLGIDKTLTGRIMRSVRANDPFEILHNAPAPHGLRIFLKAAADAGVDEDLREKAESSIADFESLIDAFPEGRSALEAAISDYIPEVRKRNERTAKQSVYKSMSYLLGYQAEASLLTTVISPSERSDMVDTTHVDSMIGLRRLRGESPVNLFGIRRHCMLPDATNWIETLGGDRGIDDAHQFLLENYCGKPIPSLRVHDSANVRYSVLDAESLPINEPVTLVNGWTIRNASLRYADDEHTHEWHSSLLRIPTRTRVQDYFVHQDVWPGPPDFVPGMPGLDISTVRTPQSGPQHDRIDMDMPVEHLGLGVHQPGIRHSTAPWYQEMLGHVFESRKLNPNEYRAYRCEIVYPVPFVRMMVWFNLAQKPHEQA